MITIPVDTEAYLNTIQSIHKAVQEDDPNIWWPVIVDRKVNEQGVHITEHLIDGQLCCSGCTFSTESDPNEKARQDGCYNALLRLTKNPSLQCALYAYPIQALKFRRANVWEDLLVGYVKGSPQDELIITPVLNGTHIYPLIGMAYDFGTHEKPKDAEWVLAAQLQTDARRTFSMYNQYLGGIPKFIEVAPSLNLIKRP